MLTAYLAPVDLEDPLQEELQNIQARYGRLFVVEGEPQISYWAQNVWFDVKTLSFTSISDAAKQLCTLHPLWAHFPHTEIRRANLITEKLPFFAPKRIAFPSKVPTGILGSWTLIDRNTLLAASRCSSPFAHGELHFHETKIPPSRAYLKLWELFTRTGRMPRNGERCLEVGASPGSWTYVLQQCGAHVLAVDRADLAPHIAKLERIEAKKGDAFQLSPNDFTQIDWVFSDLICYPEKLLAWIEPWLKTKANLVCTIKFQGKGDYGILREFEKIANSQILHLHHNKHELTWTRFNGPLS